MILCQHAVMLGLDISLTIDKDVLFGTVFSSRHKIFYQRLAITFLKIFSSVPVDCNLAKVGLNNRRIKFLE